YNLYILALGHDTRFLGTLLVAGMAGAGAGVLPAGALVDRLGPRTMLLAGSLVAAAGIGTQLVTSVAGLLLAGGVVAGIGAAAFYVAAAPFLAGNAPAGRQTDLFSLDTAVALAATAAGSATAGQLAVALGASGAALGTPDATRAYWITLLVASAVGACSFGALLLTRERPRDFTPDPSPLTEGERQSESALVGGSPREAVPQGYHLDGRRSPFPAREGGQGVRSSWRAAVADPVAVRLAVTAALIGLGVGFFLPYLNVFFVDVLGANPAVYGWVSAAGTLSRLGATLLAPRLAGRVGTTRAIGWSQLASVPLLLVLGFAPHVAIASVALLLRGALMNMAAPIQTSFTMAVLPLPIRGAGNSIVLLASNATRAASTLAGGALIATTGYRLPYLLTALAYVVSAALFLYWFARWPEGKEKPPSHVGKGVGG
ncbi:MAG: MFS transporter, partial [Chloroflexota bacterium]